MCGGFSLHNLQSPELDKLVGHDSIVKLPPNYNVRPRQSLPIIVLADGSPKGKLATWGIPFKGNDLIINSQLEKLNAPFWSRFEPCLLPANGFYEWAKNNGKSLPYYFRVKDRELFFMAGLFGVKKGAKGYSFPEFAIVTTKASPSVRKVHHRMPVIIKKGQEKRWLTARRVEAHTVLVSHRVSDAVNNGRNNYEELIYPI